MPALLRARGGSKRRGRALRREEARPGSQPSASQQISSAPPHATQPPPRVVVWDLETTTDLDVTAAETLLRLVNQLRASGRDIVFARVRDPVKDIFRRCGLLDLLGGDHIFLTVDEAVHDCLLGPLAQQRSERPAGSAPAGGDTASVPG